MVEASINPDVKIQRELVERILASSHLSKSARLTDLFQYLCRRVLEEDAQEIHEMELGHRVFGRPARYDTTADNIVRVHASLLRKRLNEYFLIEGSAEEFRVEIPRGNYAPIFHRRSPLDIVSESMVLGTAPELPDPSATHPMDINERAAKAAAQGTALRRKVLWFFQGLAALFAVVSVVLFLRLQHVKTESIAAPVLNGKAVNQFWASIFQEKAGADVVMDDASLGFYEEATGQSVPIGDYFDRTYLRSLAPGPDVALHDPNWLHQLLIRRQSNYADASLVWKLARIASSMHSDAQLDFARDLSYRQMKSDNLVLLGTPASNPWIQIFQGELTLHWQFDPSGKVYYPVDTMAPAGEMRYKAVDDSKTREGYTTVSLLPNLGGTGNTLIISGTGGAATDAAMDWLMEEPSIELLQSRLPKPRAGALPYFEVLLKIEKGTDRVRSVTILICRPLKLANRS
jgi:hypothetical protein